MVKLFVTGMRKLSLKILRLQKVFGRKDQNSKRNEERVGWRYDVRVSLLVKRGHPTRQIRTRKVGPYSTGSGRPLWREREAPGRFYRGGDPVDGEWSRVDGMGQHEIVPYWRTERKVGVTLHSRTFRPGTYQTETYGLWSGRALRTNIVTGLRVSCSLPRWPFTVSQKFRLNLQNPKYVNFLKSKESYI